jgi:hypothetical protein
VIALSHLIGHKRIIDLFNGYWGSESSCCPAAATYLPEKMDFIGSDACSVVTDCAAAEPQSFTASNSAVIAIAV